MITINGQEYHLQLVDTAGQVCLNALFMNLSVVLLIFLFFLMCVVTVHANSLTSNPFSRMNTQSSHRLTP